MTGIEAERFVCADLYRHGFLLGSRRHFPGAGDLIGRQEKTSNGLTWDGLLCEVKASSAKRGPYADFPPEDRAALRATGFKFNVEPLLAWVVCIRETDGRWRNNVVYLAEEDWPA